MLGRGFKTELWRFIATLFICFIIGLITGHTFAIITIGALAYTVRLFILIYQLEQWISRAGRLNTAPKNELKGLWADATYNIEIMLAKHKKQKRKLKKVVKKVQEMSSALADGIILIDKEDNIEWWNNSAEDLVGFQNIDSGQKVTNFIRNPAFIHYYEAKDYNLPIEVDMWQQNLHFQFQVHSFGKGEKLVVIRDITRLFMLEQMRKDFVANVSHELRTPLTVIQGYVETLADSNTSELWNKAFQQMHQQCKRMACLINDLTTLSKLETAQKNQDHRPVKLSPLLSTIVHDAKSISEDKNFNISGCDGLEIIGNESELRSALSNLIINAINYSNPSATINIKCENLNHKIVIHVIDTGIGIDPIHLPRLTERFYRADPSRSVASGGTGLGLAIVKHILIRHNAELTMTSKLGQGSTFSCHFPTNNNQSDEKLIHQNEKSIQ